MKKKSGNMLTGLAIGMAAGAIVSAFGVMRITGVSASKVMKKAKQTIKKNASNAVNRVESIVGSLPGIMG